MELQELESKQNLLALLTLDFFNAVAIQDQENQRQNVGQRSRLKGATVGCETQTIQDSSHQFCTLISFRLLPTKDLDSLRPRGSTSISGGS